jgi:hypothetical protein
MARKEIIGNARHPQDGIVAIYALCEQDHTPRYVGKTSGWIHNRHKSHIREARRGHKNLPVYRWMRRQIAANQILVVKLLEYVPPWQDWAARERHWIESLRSDGSRLLNLTLGGEGLCGHVKSPETREKIASKLRTGATFGCEVCAASFWRKRKDIAKGDCRFCSRICYQASLRGKSKAVSAVCTKLGLIAAAVARKARTHCKRGHPLSGDNLFLTTKGSRGCKSCRIIHKTTYRAKVSANG